MNKKIVITGIDTGVGKTIASAIVSEALQAYYWKPVQAGDLDASDSITVKQLTTNVQVLEERFKLHTPMSPHGAAEIDGITMRQEDFNLPTVDGTLIVEGAGGLMVPFNNEGMLFADLVQGWNLPVIVVSKHYLGSINHTLLTLEVLRKRNIDVLGVLFMGEEHPTTEDAILSNGQVRSLGRVPIVDEVTPEFVREQAMIIRENLR